MFKSMVVLFSVIVVSLFTACGGGGGGSSVSTTKINTNKSQNELGYYGDLVLFGDSLISGMWVYYEYEDNGSLNTTSEKSYRFDNGGNRELEISILAGTWIPLGEYGVSEDAQRLYYIDVESNSSAKAYYQYVGVAENNCTKVADYKDVDTSITFSKFFLLCKEY